MTATVLIEESEDALPPHTPPPAWENSAWYVLSTAPRLEARAAYELQDRGWTVFSPVFRRWVKPRRMLGPLSQRWRQVESPLYPRYVFLGSQGIPDWIGLRQVPFITGVVCVDAVPVIIPGRVLEDVFSRMSRGEFDDDRRPRKRRNPHRARDRVRVDVGSMLDLPAVVVGAKPTAPTILVEIEGTALRMVVPLDKVRSP